MNFNIESDLIFNIFLTFCRVSPVVSFFPGGNYIPTTIKLMIAIIFSILISEIVHVSTIEDNIIFTCIIESFIGIFIAMVVHLLFMTINTAGGIVSALSGVSVATIFDTTVNSSNPIVGKFFTITFIGLFFASNMHLMIITGIIKSYDVLSYNSLLVNSGDFVNYITQIINKVFELAFKISAPILAISILLYFSIGLINKMIPYIQVFFIFIPIHMWISFFVMSLYLSNIMVWFSNEFMFIINELMIEND